MPTVNATLDMAKRALIAQQGSMATSGENVANVNTPGYARRRANLRPAPTDRTQFGGLGSGVELYSITSIRDRFIEQQFHRTSSEFGWYETNQEHMMIMEGVVGDLGETSLNDAIDSFWNAWHDLASDPTSNSARTVIRERAKALGQRFSDMDGRLSFHEEQLNAEITSRAAEINDITTQLGRLNQDFQHHSSASANLEDRRSQLLDRLARLANVSYRVQDSGSVNVHLNGVALVMGKDTQTIATSLDSNGQVRLSVLEAGNLPLDISGGEIGALLNVRDDNLTVIREKLDEIAVSLANEVNRIHRSGFGLDGASGRDFFDPDVTGIADLQISADILQDLDRIAASADGMPGDNRIALAIGELNESQVLNNGTSTINQAFQETISWFGERVAENNLQAEGARLSHEQMKSWRESVSGVSLDEEMAEMIRFQHAFNAAAKIVGAADTIMQTLIAMIR